MSRSSFATLRRFAGGSQPLTQTPQEERCELCSLKLGPAHRHVLELEKRKIICACDPCALRFEGVIGGRFKIIPRDARTLANFQMTDAEWEGLALPINLAFFFFNTPARKMVAMYPSPAGATESLLPLASWQTLVDNNRVLQSLEPDVEALLVNRVRDQRDYLIVPIDKCFELVGTIRMHWRGLSGGEEVWREIEHFFAQLKG